MYEPKYQAKVYVGRNLMAHVTVVADDGKTEVYGNVFGTEMVRVAAGDIFLLAAHSILEDGVHREILEEILSEKGFLAKLRDEGPGRSFTSTQPPLVDDIPF